MSKFICLCGMTFKKKNECDFHIKMFESLDGIKELSRHKIFTKLWKERALDWITDNFKYLKLVGVMMIYFALIHHFDVKFNWWEATLIGMGMGLVID